MSLTRKGLAWTLLRGALPLLWLPTCEAGTTYRITDLNAAPNQSMVFTSLNNGGQLTGQLFVTGSSSPHAFIYDHGTITDLGTNGGRGSAGVSINTSEQIAANSSVGPPQQPNQHAFVISGAVYADLGSLLPGLVSWAASINDTGQVAGTSYTTNQGRVSVDEESRHAFLYSNGAMNDLGTLQNAGYSYGTDINGSGQVIGGSYVDVPPGALPGLYEHAFLYTNGSMTDLTPPGAVLSWAHGINDAGNIAGESLTDAPIPGGGGAFQSIIQASVYSHGVWTNIGPPVVQRTGEINTASALNNVGQVVGATPAGPFLYSNGTLVYLSALIDPTNPTNPLASALTVQKPIAINDNGWILLPNQTSADHSAIHYLLLTPQTLIFAPGSVDFTAHGLLPIGTASPMQSFKVTNSGTSAVALSGISPSGNFSETNDCPASLSSGSSCTFTVGFTPTDINTRTGNVSLTADGLLYTVALTGAGKMVLTMRASSASVAVGTPVTLTWAGSPGTTCAASGGAMGDGWTGNALASSGSLVVTEGFAGDFTYTLSCSEFGSSVQAQAIVATRTPMVSPSSNGGGGTTDWFSLLLLAGTLTLQLLQLRGTDQVSETETRFAR